jgi:hypothetical protein
MLNRDALVQMLQQLRAEHAAAEADLAVLQRRVNSLRQAVAGIEGLLDTNAAAGSLSATGTTHSTGQATLGPVEAQAKTLQDAAKADDALVVTAQPLQVSQPDRPRGAEAVRRVLAGSEGRAWTAQEMMAELERRGWLPAESNRPLDAVRVAMTRAWKAPNSNIVREGSTFSYRPSRNGDGPSAHQGAGAPESGEEAVNEESLSAASDSTE